MEDDNATVAGGQSILDLEGVTMAHFMQMTPVTMKKMVVLGQVQWVYLLRFKQQWYNKLAVHLN